MGGRNWEGLSPDPYLTGVAMNSTIRGTQEMGGQVCAKHIIGNEQETQRTNSFSSNGTEVAAMSSNIDDRKMHELCLWPFTDAIKSGVASVLYSYNQVNSTYTCENPKLLNSLIEEEIGLQACILSD